MKLSMQLDGGVKEFDLKFGVDISIPVQRKDSVSSFQIAGAIYEDYEDGGFIGNKRRGGPCNLETITFTAHGNGTHTECLGHIAMEPYYVKDCISDTYYLAYLHSAAVSRKDGSLDISTLNLSELSGHKALVLRSLPNNANKRNKDYSGQNAAYLRPEDMQRIVDAGIAHLLIDLPSVDPEWDGGKLLSHHVFWNYPQAPRTHASITEFIFVPDHVQDGTYALRLNLGNFISDASPSTPTLYPAIP